MDPVPRANARPPRAVVWSLFCDRGLRPPNLRCECDRAFLRLWPLWRRSCNPPHLRTEGNAKNRRPSLVRLCERCAIGVSGWPKVIPHRSVSQSSSSYSHRLRSLLDRLLSWKHSQETPCLTRHSSIAPSGSSQERRQSSDRSDFS